VCPPVLRRGSGAEKGAALVEFALSFPFFMLLLLGAIDLMRVSYVFANLNVGVLRAGRYASLGFAEDPSDPTANVDAVRNKIEEYSRVQLTDFRICPDASKDATCIADPAQNNRGNRNEWIFLKASSNVPVFFGAMNLNLSSSDLIRNEPNFLLVTEPAVLADKGFGGRPRPKSF